MIIFIQEQWNDRTDFDKLITKDLNLVHVRFYNRRTVFVILYHLSSLFVLQTLSLGCE